MGKTDTSFYAEFNDENGSSYGWSEADHFLFRDEVTLSINNDRSRTTEVLSSSESGYFTTANLSIEHTTPPINYLDEARLAIGFALPGENSKFVYGSAYGEVRVDDNANETITRCVPEGHSYFESRALTFTQGDDPKKLCREAKEILVNETDTRDKVIKSLTVSRPSKNITDYQCHIKNYHSGLEGEVYRDKKFLIDDCVTNGGIFERCTDANAYFESALQIAQESNKKVLIIFGYGNPYLCGECNSMYEMLNKELGADSRLLDLVKEKYVVLAINASANRRLKKGGERIVERPKYQTGYNLRRRLIGEEPDGMLYPYLAIVEANGEKLKVTGILTDIFERDGGSKAVPTAMDAASLYTLHDFELVLSGLSNPEAIDRSTATIRDRLIDR